MHERVAATAASDLFHADNTLDSLPWSDRARVWAGMQARSLPDSLAREIQLLAFRSLSRVMAIVSCLGLFGTVTVAIALLPWDETRARWWFVIHVLEYVGIASACVWTRRKTRDGTVTLARLNMVLVGPAFVGGVLWGVLPSVVRPADGDINFAVFSAACTTAALIATIGFFWLFGNWPMCVMFSSCALTGATWSYSQFDSSGSVMFALLACACMTTLVVLSGVTSHALFYASYDTIVARDRKQFVELLLRDHDRGGLDFLWETDEDLVFGPVPKRMMSAAGGDERVKQGKSLLALVEDPEARAKIAAREPFDATVITVGPEGIGELRLSGRPKSLGGIDAGYQGIGTDAATARRAAEAERFGERLDTMVALTGGLAHDFNNQLATVLGAVELVALDPAISDSSQTLLTRATEACMRTRRITSDLVVASGHSATYRAIPFELGPTIAQVVADVGPLYPEVQIVTDSADSVWVEADRMQYMRAVRNLIENGCQAVLSPGYESDRALEVRVSTWQDHVEANHWAYTEVVDTGPGIDEGALAMLFEPFYTTRRHLGGTGLGLSIARGFAYQARGALAADNTDGARFRLTIPGVRKPAVVAEHRDDDDNLDDWIPHVDGLVLVVEDDPSLALNVRQMLENYGARVEVANSVQAALTGHLDHAAEFVGVVSDLVLPDGEGYEVIARFRGRVPDLKAIYMSGYTTTLPSTVAPELRCPFLPKPFSSAEFRAALRSAGIGTPATVAAATPKH